MLDKMIYTEHEMSKKLKDVSVNSYTPLWNKPNSIKQVKIEKPAEQIKIIENEQKEITSFDDF